MEEGEPSEKPKVAHARGQPESKTVNGTIEQDDKNEEKTSEDEEREEEEEESTDSKNTRAAVYTYSREDLNDLRNCPASKIWPVFADKDCVRNGVWDPEVWHHTPESAKRCASPVEDIKRQFIIEDGIVLSPQRQSFGQGCHVPQSAPERGLRQERTKGMLSRTLDRDARDGRSRLTGRVGRGSRSLDYRTPVTLSNRNGDLRQTSPWEREKNDKEYKRSREEDGYGYKRARKRYEDEPEPEWVTYGPTSQLETIELRGFNNEERYGIKGRGGSFNDSIGNASKSSSKQEKLLKKEKEKREESPNVEKQEKDDTSFDINQFFMTDTFLQFSGVPDQSNASRFRQFFGGSGNGSIGGSRRSSTAEELLEFSGLSGGSPSTPRTLSPHQNFMFTPIKPVPTSTDPGSLAEMLQNAKIDVQPLLDKVMSTGKEDTSRVKGTCRLEDLEKSINTEEQTSTIEPDVKKVKDGGGQDMAAFFKLVETMKTSGNLPEKPQPVIPGLPSHLLPRPPSPKSKTNRRTPSPLQKFQRSSPTQIEMLQHIMQSSKIPSPSIPSPPQVVPQMNRPYSPLETPLYKSIEMMRRSPSPLNSMYEPKPFSPLLAPQAFCSPSPMHPHVQSRGSPRLHFIDKPRFDLANEHTPSKQMSKPDDIVRPKVSPRNQSALRDLAFMPTSVLQKIKKDQMTPKSKVDSEDSKKENDTKRNIEQPSVNLHNDSDSLLMAAERQIRQLADKHPSDRETFSIQQRNLFSSFNDETKLLKPTAFKPYAGASHHSVSPLRSGVHSEPQSPVSYKPPGSPGQNLIRIPNSAPVTPQRHPQAERQFLNLMSRKDDMISKVLTREKQPLAPSHFAGGAASNQREKSAHLNNDMPLQNEMIQRHNAKQDHEQQQQQRAVSMQHEMRQHSRIDDLHNYNNMYRHRGHQPPHMTGGRVSPQSMSYYPLQGSPGPPRTPFNTPLTNMHHPGKQGMMMRPPLPHPAYMRMMHPAARAPSMPMRGSPAPLAHMMPQQHPLMYGQGHTPMPGHPGYPPMMPPPATYPVQRHHPGYIHNQVKAPSTLNPLPDPNSRRSPNNANILSKWFSEDVLKSTQKIPTAHDISGKKVMSVEDLERQQSMFTALTL